MNSTSHIRMVSLLIDLNDDIIVEIASRLDSLTDLNALFLSSKRMSNMSNQPHLAARWIENHAEPLSRKDLRNFFTKKPLEFHLSVTRFLLASESEYQTDRFTQDWDDWALTACQLGHDDVADLLFSTPAAWVLGRADSGQQLEVGVATDLMLQPLPPSGSSSCAADAAPSHPAQLQQHHHSRPASHKRPLISRYSYSPAGNPSYMGCSPPVINRLSAVTISSAGSAAGATSPFQAPSSSSRASNTEEHAEQTVRKSAAITSQGQDEQEVPSNVGYLDAAENMIPEVASKVADGRGESVSYFSSRQSQTSARGIGPSTSGPWLADVGYCDNAALRHACLAGDLAMVRMLVGHGADVGARDGSPLALAAGEGHVAVVQYLVDEAGADVRAGGGVALTASIASDRPEHLDILSLILSKGANVHSSDNFALRWACSHGRLGVAKLLLKHGADVSAGVQDSLYHAAKNGHAGVVRVLLANGADASQCRDAVTLALERGHTEVVALLKAATRKRSLLHFLGKCFLPK